ncbi:MAG: hypothetical protein U1E65_31025 [Myxococcota bacterium]
MSLRLHLGDRSKDEASLSAYLAAALSKQPFERVLDVPTGQAPWLEEDGRAHRGLLAILDRLSQLCPPGTLWPTVAAREAAEAALHGSGALRRAQPFGLQKQPFSAKAAGADLAELDRRWSAWRSERPDAAFLFGAFCGLDALFAPLAFIVVRDGLPVSADANAYAQAVVATPAFQRWIQAAAEDARASL